MVEMSETTILVREGAKDDASEGNCDSNVVGLKEDDEVGLEDFTNVGEKVGETVGNLVVGLFVGLPVGDFTNLGEGFGDDKLGNSIKLLKPSKKGCCMGCSVGAGMGLN